MRNTLPLLDKIRFPAIRRGKLETLQINVGYPLHIDAASIPTSMPGPTAPKK